MLHRHSPIKLLLVDDRAENLLVLESVLGTSDYSLILAHSGREAITLLEQNPDTALILLDVQMPIIDGFETARQIKRVPELKDIPIIFITAIHREDPFIREGYEVGAIDYFSKPFDPEILKQKVKIYASFRQRENRLREKERQMKESEALLRAGRKLSSVLESLPVGVIIADTAGRVSQSNEVALKILQSVQKSGFDSYAEFMSWWDHDGQLLKGPDGPLMRALSGGSVSHNEITAIKCLDGTEKAVFISASPMRGRDHHIVGAVVVLQDVTEHREIEADFEKRIAHLLETAVA